MKKVIILSLAVTSLALSANAQDATLKQQRQEVRKEFRANMQQDLSARKEQVGAIKQDLRNDRQALKSELQNSDSKIEKKDAVRDFRGERREAKVGIVDARKDFRQEKRENIRGKRQGLRALRPNKAQ